VIAVSQGLRLGNFVDSPAATGYAASAMTFSPAHVFCTCGATNGKSLYMSMISRLSHKALLLSALVLVACDSEQPPAAVSPVTQEPPPTAAEPVAVESEQSSPAGIPAVGADAGVKEIDWDALIPDDYSPEKLLAEYQPENMEDDDPRAAELMEKLRKLWDEAPVRPELDGQTVKLPGFTVPLEGDSQETSSFLLVPYYGACIHVPPPPANQTVFVLTQPGKGTRLGEFDVVWVTGTMSVKRMDNDLAEAGYTLYATEIAPYEE
jgi:hypothetical protein